MLQPAHIIRYFLVLAVPSLLVWFLRARPAGTRLTTIAALWVYAGLLLSVTLFPMPVQADLIADLRLEQGWRSHNVRPLGTMLELLRDHPWAVVRRQLVGSMVMLAPLGVLLPLLSGRLRGFRAVILVVIGVAVAIESVQFAISMGFGFVYKSADIDDLLLNTAGGVLGWTAYRAAMAWPPLAALLRPFHLEERRGDGLTARATSE